LYSKAKINPQTTSCTFRLEVNCMAKASETYNLCVLRPDLAREWHPTKNGGLGPKDVTPGSGKKVWWLCDDGHWWQSSVRDRSRGKQCSFCKTLERKSEQRMVDLKPQLLKEWHPSRNRELSVRTVLTDHKEKVWWICEQGHEWEATIRSRLAGKSCPMCIGSMPRVSAAMSSEIRPASAVADHYRPLSADERWTPLPLDGSASFHGTEQRKHPRYERSAVVMIEKLRLGPLGYAHLQNFSAGGMLLRSDFSVKPGEVVSIKLDQPLYSSASTAVSSQVIWCRNLETSSDASLPFGIGLRVM